MVRDAGLVLNVLSQFGHQGLLAEPLNAVAQNIVIALGVIEVRAGSGIAVSQIRAVNHGAINGSQLFVNGPLE